MGSTEMIDSDVEEQHLSIDPKKSKRTITLALPPERSPSASFDTMVPDSPDFEPRPGPITRRGTHVAEVKLSYWDLIKGLFTGVKNLRRKLAREIEWADPKEGRVKHLGNTQHPFILDVSVFRREDDDIIKARCVLDTGSTQGNIISERLARRLGFKEYSPLRDGEEHGGKAVTGHIHQVKGAVRVSWYHHTSPKVFVQMRFLVSESDGFDMLIGAASICKEKMLPAPNFGAEYVEVAGKNDNERNRLKAAENDCESAVKKTSNELADLEKGGKKGTEKYRKLEKKWKKKQAEYEKAKKDVEDYEAGRSSRSPSPQVDAGAKNKKGHEGKDAKDVKDVKNALKKKKTQ